MKLWTCPVPVKIQWRCWTMLNRWTQQFRGSAPPGIAWSDATLPAMPEPHEATKRTGSRRICFEKFYSHNLHTICIILHHIACCRANRWNTHGQVINTMAYGCLSRHSVCLDNPDFRSVHLRSRTNTSAIATWLGTTAPSVVLGIYLRMNHACPTNINQWCSCEATSTSDKWVWSPTCAAMLR